jgi:hypothetical protein
VDTGSRLENVIKQRSRATGMAWIKPKNDGAVPLTARQGFSPAIGLRKHGGLRNAARTYIVRSPFVQYRFALSCSRYLPYQIEPG